MAQRTIFISYAHENRPEVEPSAELLRAGGVQVFIDVAGIAYGDRWQDTLQQALDQCERVMVFWSLAAKASEWVDREWRYALQLGKRIVPTLLDDTPLPPELSQFQTLSQRRSADAAAQRDGRTWLPTAVAAAAALTLGAGAMWWFEEAEPPPPNATVPLAVSPAPSASATAAPAPRPPSTAAERLSLVEDKRVWLDAARRQLEWVTRLKKSSGVTPTSVEEVHAGLVQVFSPEVLKLMDREDLLALAKAVTQARQAVEMAQAKPSPRQAWPVGASEDHSLEALRVELERASAAIDRAQVELDRPVPAPTPAPPPAASSASAAPASAPSLQPTTPVEPAADFGAQPLAIPIGLGLLFCAVGAGVWLRRGKRGSKRAEAADYVARVFGA